MNVMGMGIPELGVILLVAFLVLGPSRAIEMARSAGKIMGDLRRSFGEVTSAMTVESTEQVTPTRNQGAAFPPEEAPGVPIRADIPPEEEPDQEPASDSEPEPEPEPGAKG
jgi:Sec-independent protein translocase protein TatA